MITEDETAAVLAVACEIDGRELTDTMATAWMLALRHAGITADEAMNAVPVHYAESTYAIKPADVVRIALAARHERIRAARREEARRRHALPPGTVPEPGTVPLRDRREDLHKLIESFRVAPDGTERWPLAGDPDMRRRQTFSPNPEVQRAAEEASRAKAREIVAESRARRGETTE